MGQILGEKGAMENLKEARSEQKRIEEVDIAKGIAIIFVVLGHLHIQSINEFSYSFHMPLFIILSGMFLGNTTSLKTEIKKRFMSLIVPYVITEIAIVFGKIVFNLIEDKEMFLIISETKKQIISSVFGMGGYSTHITGIEYVFERNCGAVWFLLALFWGSIVCRVIINKCNNPMLAAGAVTWLAYTLNQTISLPFRMMNGIGFCFYLCYGYSLYKNKKYNNKLSALETIIFIVVWGIEIYRPGFSEVSGITYPLGVLSVIAGISATHIILNISRFLMNVPIIGFILKKIGKTTLLILCVHSVESQVIPWDNLMCNDMHLQFVLISKTLIITVTTILLVMCKNIGIHFYRDR